MLQKTADSYLSTKVQKSLYKFFDKSYINQVGKSSGFTKGKVQKISAFNFVAGFLLCCLRLHNTYQEWARQITELSGKSLSRQGLWWRVTEYSEAFAQRLLEKLLLKKAFHKVKAGLFEAFKRVLLQDSTCLHLSDALSELFKGSKVKGVQKAIARIQSLIDIKKMQFLQLSLGSYSQNDQGASSSILPFLGKGDVVIRDLGYFTLKVFAKIMEQGADFVSRLKFGVKLYDYYGKEINLSALLKKGKRVDRWIYVGAEQKLWVRLIIVPLPKGEAAERVRRARQRADKRYQRARGYYQWFAFDIYITSVEESVWNPTQVRDAYGVRWNIEMVFKAWKSGFHLQELMSKNCAEPFRVKTNIYLLLLFITLFMQKIYMVYFDKAHKATGQLLSIVKLSAFAFENFIELLGWTAQKLKQQLCLHCCYEKRKDRTNMTEQLIFY